MSEYEIDKRGFYRPRPDTTGMMFPVQCRCGHVYDMGAVTVTGRFTDCSVWRCPGCGVDTDDRIEGWGPRRKYVELGR